MNLKKYISNRTFRSVLKGIPLSSENNYSEIRDIIHRRCEVLNSISGIASVTPRFIFRGPRTVHQECTLKDDAHSFDVYLKVKTDDFFNFSHNQKEEIREVLTNQFQNLI